MAHISATHPQVRQDAATLSSEAAPNPYRLRLAAEADVRTLEEIEREAFPTMTAGTPFRSDVGRSTSHYLVAVRGGAGPGVAEGTRQSGVAGRMVRAARSFASLLMLEGPRRRPRTSLEYVAGFAGLWFVLDECHVISIATRRDERRRGVGELMMIGAFEAALAKGSRVLTLEVRASNHAAKTLYRKYGFEEVGLRRRYYTDNGEDAIIMTTTPVVTAEFKSRFDSLVSRHAARWGVSPRVQPVAGQPADAH